MKNLVSYLESKDAVFHGALALIILYVPHAGHLFKELEHLDMTVFGFTFFNWVYGITLAGVIEFLILIFIINGHRSIGKFYAIVSFFLNAFYYDYWFMLVQDQTLENVKLTTISGLICLTHSLSVWQLSELFYKKVRRDKDEEKGIGFCCDRCAAGPFQNKRALDGHISRAHKGSQKISQMMSRSQEII